jgi:penicillin-binding protein 1A
VAEQRPARRAQGKANGPPKKRGFFGNLAYWSLVLGLWGGVVLAGVFIWLASDLPDPATLWAKTDRPSIVYVDINNEIVARRGAPDAPPIDLKTLPKYVPAAIVAIEDRKFYRHWGFDLEGLARAAVVNAQAGRVVQGGSTLTQQLAKNLFLSSEQSMRRKAQELLLSVWLESRFNKEELLSLYMSRVYFGAGAWGIEAASRRYFDKTPQQLTLAEAALLAGLLKAPSRFSPVSDAVRAQGRATVVLDVMAKTGVITPQEREAAVKQPVRVARTAPGGGAGYFVDWISSDAGTVIGEPTEDVIVETTLDMNQQRAAERALAVGLGPDSAKRRVAQGTVIGMQGDGAVRALVGGKSYDDSQFNRAVEAKRQPGSAFKPFVYLAAIEAGLSPWTSRFDQETRIGDWTPQNYDGRYRGEMTIQAALGQSINTIAVQLAEEVGRDTVIRTARRLGITSRLEPNRSLALGSDVVTPLELTAAYAPFANGGNAVIPYGIKRIRTVSGKVLYERRSPSARRVIDDRPLALMNMMMTGVVDSGTGTAAKVAGRPIAGKTGTTSDYRDAWFVGYTGNYVASVWVGNDDYSKMAKITGGSIPARVWRQFVGAGLAGKPAVGFAMPATDDPEAYPTEATLAGVSGEALGPDGLPIVPSTETPEISADPANGEPAPPNPDADAQALDDLLTTIETSKPKAGGAS